MPYLGRHPLILYTVSAASTCVKWIHFYFLYRASWSRHSNFIYVIYSLVSERWPYLTPKCLTTFALWWLICIIFNSFTDFCFSMLRGRSFCLSWSLSYLEALLHTDGFGVEWHITLPSLFEEYFGFMLSTAVGFCYCDKIFNNFFSRSSCVGLCITHRVTIQISLINE